MHDEAARRTYWTEQMDEGYAFMQQMCDYPVVECGEPMAYLPEAADAAGVEVAFSDRPASNGEPRLYYLRAGLLPAFLGVTREMNDRGWVLKVEDAFRTMSMQQWNARLPLLFERIVNMVRWECGATDPPLDLLTRRTAALIAPSPKVGTHLSGSAMDVSVLDRATGNEIDRGRPYLELSERTPMDSPFVSESAQRHRREITALFARHGFATYPWEFWHYNDGDAYAEYLRRSGRPARYGPVHLDPATGRVTPIEHPLELLNTPDDFTALLKGHGALAGQHA